MSIFQNRGVCGQAFPPFPSPTPLLPLFCSRLIFRAARMRKTPSRGPNFVRVVRERLLRRLQINEGISWSNYFLLILLFRNQFVMEYCGEVMNYKDFQERAERYDRENRRHYYFMTLRADEVNCRTLLHPFRPNYQNYHPPY